VGSWATLYLLFLYKETSPYPVLLGGSCEEEERTAEELNFRVMVEKILL
jgi:hypothetical protein